MDRTSTFKTTFIFTFHNTSHVVKRELVVSFELVFSVPTEHKRPNFRSSPDISTQQNYY